MMMLMMMMCHVRFMCPKKYNNQPPCPCWRLCKMIFSSKSLGWMSLVSVESSMLCPSIHDPSHPFASLFPTLSLWKPSSYVALCLPCGFVCNCFLFRNTSCRAWHFVPMGVHLVYMGARCRPNERPWAQNVRLSPRGIVDVNWLPLWNYKTIINDLSWM